MKIKSIKNKNMKWWIGIGSCVLLFAIIGIFGYEKMCFVWKGVEIKATIEKQEGSSLAVIKGIAAKATRITLNGREIFIDKEGTQIKGKQACEKAWNAFFNLFADYKNIFESIICHDDIVIMQGQSLCSDKRLDGKAIWTAKISNNKISEWRVYNDTPELRQALKL